MSDSPAVDDGSGGAAQARKLLWPVAVIVFLFTVSYPANDILRPDAETLTLPGFLAHAGIALATAVVVFALLIPWALRRESSGAVALALSIIGTLFAFGFWVGFPQAMAAGGALLGWAGNQRDQGSPVVTNRVRDRVARRDFQRLRASAVLLISTAVDDRRWLLPIAGELAGGGTSRF